jgi:hypothetical protein
MRFDAPSRTDQQDAAVEPAVHWHEAMRSGPGDQRPVKSPLPAREHRRRGILGE